MKCLVISVSNLPPIIKQFDSFSAVSDLEVWHGAHLFPLPLPSAHLHFSQNFDFVLICNGRTWYQSLGGGGGWDIIYTA